MAETRSDDESDAPEELTLGQGRDAAEVARKQENDNKKKLALEARCKRRKQIEANREAKLKKLDKRMKKTVTEEPQDLAAKALAKKNAGFLDPSVIEFLVNKEREQASKKVVGSEAQPDATRSRKRKKKLVNVNVNGRTKLVILNDTPGHARSGAEFYKQRLHGTNRKRSLTMLRSKAYPRA